MRRIAHILLLLCLMVSFASCIGEEEVVSGPADIVMVGQRLPDFSVEMDDGTTVTPQSLNGKPAVIVFFHTSCSDCQKALPVVQGEYEREAPAVSFVCISREENAASVSAYWAKASLTMPFSAQVDSRVYRLFARQTVPRIYVADRMGVVRRVFVEKVSRKELEEAIRLLK